METNNNLLTHMTKRGRERHYTFSRKTQKPFKYSQMDSRRAGWRIGVGLIAIMVIIASVSIMAGYYIALNSLYGGQFR